MPLTRCCPFCHKDIPILTKNGRGSSILPHLQVCCNNPEVTKSKMRAELLRRIQTQDDPCPSPPPPSVVNDSFFPSHGGPELVNKIADVYPDLSWRELTFPSTSSAFNGEVVHPPKPVAVVLPSPRLPSPVLSDSGFSSFHLDDISFPSPFNDSELITDRSKVIRCPMCSAPLAIKWHGTSIVPCFVNMLDIESQDLMSSHLYYCAINHLH
jgi:hypothetical protein